MEPFSTKLYEKYNNLKKRKFFEEEEWNHKREADLRNYQSATEDLVEELKSENERLRAEISSMQQQYSESQILLLEESKKTKELSAEVGRLQNLLSKKNGINYIEMPASPNTTPQSRSRERSERLDDPQTTNSLSKEQGTQPKQTTSLPHISCQEEQIVPHCYRRNLANSGDASEGCSNCVFQTLIKFLVGMDFSVDTQREGLCLVVIHQMSGYTFKLTLVQHEGGEGELKYHVSSLGTLERVALDWMKEDITFSMTMCRVFFERISRVIGFR